MTSMRVLYDGGIVTCVKAGHLLISNAGRKWSLLRSIKWWSQGEAPRPLFFFLTNLIRRSIAHSLTHTHTQTYTQLVSDLAVNNAAHTEYEADVTSHFGD